MTENTNLDYLIMIYRRKMRHHDKESIYFLNFVGKTKEILQNKYKECKENLKNLGETTTIKRMDIMGKIELLEEIMPSLREET